MKKRSRRAVSIKLRTATLAALAAWIGLAQAAEVGVVVTDRDGRPLSGVALELQPVINPGAADSAGADPWTYYVPPRGRGTTDLQGFAVLETARPGTYVVSARVPDGYVGPESNPFAAAPQVTVEGDEDRFEVELSLWRGGPLGLEMDVRTGPEKSVGQVEILGLDGAFTRTVPLRHAVAEELILVPGRYELALIPPQGLLLEGLSTDGQRLPGGRVLIEIEEGWTSSEVLWKVGASARIEGTVSYQDERLAVTPVAWLVDPGPWAAEVAGAGGWDVEQVRGRFVDAAGERYQMFLPDGTWRVVLEGEGVVSDPESVELFLAAGETGRADFRVSGARLKGCGLYVSVRGEGPHARSAGRGARVGLWAGDADPLERPPLRVEPVHMHGSAVFEDLEPGRYQAVARWEGHLDGSTTVDARCEGDAEGGSATITLETGATVRFEARDEDGEPVRDALLVVEASDPPARAVFGGADGLQFVHEQRSDDSGRGLVSGLYAGDYRLSARMEGRHARTRFVRIRGAGEQSDVSLGPGAETSVALEVLPAASLEATLVCDDGKALPDAVSAVAVKAFDFDENGAAVGDLLAESELALEDVTLGGDLREDLVVGPLEEDVYLLALRPHGFRHWTWAGSGGGPDDAIEVHAKIGETRSAGIVQVPCAPRVEVLVSVAEGDREMFRRDLLEVVTTFETVPEGHSHRVTVSVDGDRILLTGMPASEGALRVRLTHPHVLPDGALELEVKGRFERGRVIEKTLTVPALGGAIELLARAPAVRVAQQVPTAEPRLGKVVSERVLVPALEPGNYTVTLCRDAACSGPGDGTALVVRDLPVERGRTTTLELRD